MIDQIMVFPTSFSVLGRQKKITLLGTNISHSKDLLSR